MHVCFHNNTIQTLGKNYDHFYFSCEYFIIGAFAAFKKIDIQNGG